jgi:hypothetical protein
MSWVTRGLKAILNAHAHDYHATEGDARHLLMRKLKQALREAGGKKLPKKLTKVVISILFAFRLMIWLAGDFSPSMSGIERVATIVPKQGAQTTMLTTRLMGTYQQSWSPRTGLFDGWFTRSCPMK